MGLRSFVGWTLQEVACMTNEAIPVTGVSELVLEVVDLEAAERFYTAVLGLPVVERWPDREVIWMIAGNRTRIGLWRPQVGLARARGGVHVHYAMHVPDEGYEAAVTRLKDQGQAVEEHRFATYQDSRAAYVTDPDGNVVELWTWDVANHFRGVKLPISQTSPTRSSQRLVVARQAPERDQRSRDRSSRSPPDNPRSTSRCRCGPSRTRRALYPEHRPPPRRGRRR
jgi:catechol 2,3-dioxygenase-like lactoylglutathione lyase family enzyme